MLVGCQRNGLQALGFPSPGPRDTSNSKNNFSTANTLAALYAAFLFVVSEAAYGCSCAPGTIEQQVEQASDVVSAEVEKDLDGRGLFRVRIEHRWKGTALDLSTIQAGGPCRYRLQPGARYVLFLRRDSTDRLRTGLCAGNRRLENAASLIDWLARRPSAQQD